MSQLDSALQPGDTDQKPSLLDGVMFAALLLLMLFGLGQYGLYEPHEAHFAGVGREMVTRGDWITPHLNGAPYLNKPPLLYWMIALSYTLLGTVNEFAARLPLALISFSGCLLCWQWAREVWGIRAGRMAALMLVSTSGWYLFSHQLMIELLLCVLFLASAYFLWKAICEPDTWHYWVAFYVAIGLNVLAKGPLGLGMAVLVLLGFAAWRRDWSLLRKCRPLLGMLIISALVGPWLVPMELRNPGYLKYAIWSENIDRAMDRRWPPDYDVVKVSVIPYVLFALVWLAPWSLLTPQLFSFVRARLKEDAPGSSIKEKNAATVLALTALMPVLFFIPIKARLVYYQLPMLPPFIILAAAWFAFSNRDDYRRGRTGASIAFILSGLAVILGGLLVPGAIAEIRELKAAPGTVDVVDEIAYILGAAMLTGGVLLYLRRSSLALLATVVIFSLASIHNLAGFRAFDAVRSSRRVVENLREKAGPDCIWISEGSKEIGASAGIAYYLGQDAKGGSRSVYIMKDGDKAHRSPPKFPYGEPKYLIDTAKLNALWSGTVPVLFVTDFQRKSFDTDPPRLPEGEKHELSAELKGVECGQRRVYANPAAYARIK